MKIKKKFEIIQFIIMRHIELLPFCEIYFECVTPCCEDASKKVASGKNIVKNGIIIIITYTFSPQCVSILKNI